MTTRTWDDMSRRERDALVATEVMGWRRSDSNLETGNALLQGEPLFTRSDDGMLVVARRENPGPWHPTEDMAATWEVVEKLEAGGRWLWLSRSRDGWTAVFSSHENKAPLHPKAAADTAPGAICIAALRAIGAAP